MGSKMNEAKFLTLRVLQFSQGHIHIMDVFNEMTEMLRCEYIPEAIKAQRSATDPCPAF